MNEKLAMLNYQVASPKHLALHKSQKKVRAICGGNRSGKTYWGRQEVVWHLFGIHPYHAPFPHPRSVRICVMNEKQGIKGIMLPKLKEILPLGSYHWNAEPQTIDVAVGDGKTALIEFLTYEQDIDKYGGTSRTLVWCDEEPKYKAQYVQNLMRTIDSRGEVIMSFTPLEGLTWAFTEIIEARNPLLVDYEHISIYDNKFLPADEIKLIEDSVDPDMADAVIWGRFISPSGLVYKKFRTDVHVIDPYDEIPKEWMVVLGIDTHEAMRNPQAVVFCAFTPEKEIIVFDEIVEYCLINELAEKIQQKLDEWKIDYRFAVMDISQKSAISGVDHAAELRRAGLRKIRTAKKKKGTPQEGRSKVKMLLDWERDEEGNLTKKPQLYFTRNVQQTIWEIRHYMYADWASHKMQDARSPKEEVRKKDDHTQDALRYVIQENIHYVSIDKRYSMPMEGGKHLIRGVEFKKPKVDRPKVDRIKATPADMEELEF